MWISIYETKPVIVKEKDPTPGASEYAEIKKVVLENGYPKLVTSLLGKLRV